MISIGEINSCTVGTNQLKCFDFLTPEEAKLLDDNTLEIEYSRGETICKQGTFASHIMVLMDGLAKIYMEGNNESVILKILPAINIIGLPILYEGNNIFQYSAQTYLPSTVRLIEINTFKEILSTNAKFASKIVSLQSENSVITYGRFFCLTKKQTNGRLADIILTAANVARIPGAHSISRLADGRKRSTYRPGIVIITVRRHIIIRPPHLPAKQTSQKNSLTCGKQYLPAEKLRID